MNQILSVNVESTSKGKKRYSGGSKGPLEIESILKFFVISLLIFGIFMIGSGSYSMYKEMTSAKTDAKPVIYIEQVDQNQISLRITHNKELQKVTYQWNMEEEIEIPSKGKKQVEEIITIPEGTNAFIVRATDINGQEIEYRKVYTIDNPITIKVEQDGNELKIKANASTMLSYMTYRWDDEEEQKIDINNTEIEKNISIPKGRHNLTIEVVDENNTTKEFKQEIIVTTRPQLEVTTDGTSNFVIRASDEQGIKRVEFIINETQKYVLNLEQVFSLEDRKEFEYYYPLEEGENRLEVTVYNEDDVTETSRVLVNR